MSENDDPRDLDNSYKHYYAVSNDLGLNSLACGVPASHFDVINGDSEDDETEKDAQTWKQKLCHFYDKESLLIEVLLAISIAYMYPKIGDVYLFPDVTAHWIAVIIIFCEWPLYYLLFCFTFGLSSRHISTDYHSCLLSN